MYACKCVCVVWSRYVQCHTVCTLTDSVHACTICIELVPILDFLPIPQNGSHPGSDLVTENSCKNRKYKPKLKLHLPFVIITAI